MLQVILRCNYYIFETHQATSIVNIKTLNARHKPTHKVDTVYPSKNNVVEGDCIQMTNIRCILIRPKPKGDKRVVWHMYLLHRLQQERSPFVNISPQKSFILFNSFFLLLLPALFTSIYSLVTYYLQISTPGFYEMYRLDGRRVKTEKKEPPQSDIPLKKSPIL